LSLEEEWRRPIIPTSNGANAEGRVLASLKSLLVQNVHNLLKRVTFSFRQVDNSDIFRVISAVTAFADFMTRAS